MEEAAWRPRVEPELVGALHDLLAPRVRRKSERKPLRSLGAVGGFFLPVIWPFGGLIN